MAFTILEPTLTSKQKEWVNKEVIILAKNKRKFFGCKCGVRPIAALPSANQLWSKGAQLP